MSRIERTEQVVEAVGSLAPEQHGMLLYGRDARSSVAVMVAGGEICWAVATASDRRLLDVLEDRGALARGQISPCSVTPLCRGRRIWFGEWLVDHGVVPASELVGALTEQAHDALSHLTPEMGEPIWLPADPARTPRYRVSLS
jgi:hypothetical protein